METTSFSLMELFELGGLIMWPLLVFSIATVAISIERAVYLLYHNLRLDDMANKVSEYVENKDYSGAREYLAAIPKRRVGAKILQAIVKNTGSGKVFSERRTERAVETEAIKCINSLETGLNYLTALGSIAPLTGFLGTVTGMIGAFRSIAEATEVNAQIVANGIYEALITTVFGLIIAIIAMASHSIISHIVDKFASKVEGHCSDLINQIAGQAESRTQVSSVPKRTIKTPLK
jgi:biopolymer transport protein ExbB